MPENVIRLWPFADAPEEWKKLAGDDAPKADLLAHVPAALVGLLPWFEPGHFGGKVLRNQLADGSVVYIRIYSL